MGTMQPPQFVLTGDMPSVEYKVQVSEDVLADCVVAERAGRPVLVELHLRCSDDRLACRGISARLLRQIRVNDILGPARDEFTRLASEPDWLEAAPYWWGYIRERPRPGRRGHPDQVYASTALAYVRAVSRGSAHPVADVAHSMRMSRDRVRDLLHEARRRGLLTTSGRGRAGGSLTPRCARILNDARMEAGEHVAE